MVSIIDDCNDCYSGESNILLDNIISDNIII